MLRQTLRDRRQGLTAEVLAQSAERAAAHLVRQACWNRARVVALHAACRGELPTQPVIDAAWAAGKRVALPCMTEQGMAFRVVTPATRLVAGRHAIPEPPSESATVEPRELELVLVPGLAFDRAGRRLGQGGGDYDRLLALLPEACATVGWCHAFQCVDRVPTEPHDRRVQLVITPDGPCERAD